MTLNGQAPGEGWTWEYFYPNTTKNHDITLDRVWRTGDTTVTLRARLYSTTLQLQHAGPYRHGSGSMIRSSGRSVSTAERKGLFEKTFPVRWLKEGCEPREDHFGSDAQLSEPVLSGLVRDRLHARACCERRDAHLCHRSGGGEVDRRIRVRGLPQPAVTGAGPDRERGRSARCRVLSEAGGTWAAVFDDTVSVPRRYPCRCRYRGHASARGWCARRSPGCASISTGADYIIITHALFRAAADRLAAHRASHNGVRTLPSSMCRTSMMNSTMAI